MTWIERHIAVFVVLGLLGLGYLGWEVHQQANLLGDTIHNQNINRATNVHTWCGAINEGRDYNRAFVFRVTRGRIAYTLADKNCTSIERKTLASAGITGKRQNLLIERIDSKRP